MEQSTPDFNQLLTQAQRLSPIERLRLSTHLLTGLEPTIGQEPQAIVQPRRTVLSPRDTVLSPRETDDITYDIIGGAMDIHRTLGPGYREDTYQRDLESSYARRNLLFTPQKIYDVYDSTTGGGLIGYYIADFLVENRVIVEIKALDGLNSSHEAQVIGYLAVSGCEVGLLINFGKRSLEWKRILPPKNIQEHKLNRQWLFVPDWLHPEQIAL